MTAIVVGGMDTHTQHSHTLSHTSPLPYPEMEYGVLQIDGQTLRTSEMRTQGSIGNGNFGYVYRVDHPALGISAAVKVCVC